MLANGDSQPQCLRVNGSRKGGELDFGNSERSEAKERTHGVLARAVSHDSVRLILNVLRLFVSLERLRGLYKERCMAAYSVGRLCGQSFKRHNN